MEANDEVSRLFGFSVDHILGKPLATMVPIDDRRAFRQCLNTCATGSRLRRILINLVDRAIRGALSGVVSAKVFAERDGVVFAFSTNASRPGAKRSHGAAGAAPPKHQSLSDSMLARLGTSIGAELELDDYEGVAAGGSRLWVPAL